MAKAPSKGPARVFVARHGQSVSNREGRFCGHSETPLTERGVAQAQALSGRLAATRIDAVYTSDFSRAIDTAAIVLEGRGLTPSLDPGLREIHYGEWEMRLEREIARTDRDEFRRMSLDDPAWQPPGGETVAMVRERTLRSLEGIFARHPHQTVLVVTHGTAINCMLAGVLGMDPAYTFRIEVANCGLSELVMRGKRLFVRLINDTSHLAQAGLLP